MLKMTAIRIFENSGTTHPTTPRNFEEELNNQQYRCENLKSRIRQGNICSIIKILFCIQIAKETSQA
jgi:hypothetical protein